jgi:hypothetical protein
MCTAILPTNLSLLNVGNLIAEAIMNHIKELRL